MKAYFLLPALLMGCALVTNAQIEISEINYNNDSTLNSGNWVEFHNRGNTALNLTSWQFTDANPFNIFNFPLNQSIAAGGYLVVVDDSAKFKNIHPGVPFIGEFQFGLSNTSDTITLYDNNGSVVYNVAYWDSSPWQKTADGMGRTLTLRTSGADPQDPANWFAGCMGGSPGAAYTPCNDPVVFSEINYNSVLQINSGDWVELHNTTASPIDLSNWELKDRYDTNVYVFPAGTVLPANGYLVASSDTAFFKSTFPNVSNWVGELDFHLSNAGDRIRLYNAQTGRIQFSLVFNDKAPWPAAADGQGYTMELMNENGIMNDGDNWQAGCLGGSPGKAYDPGCGTGISDVARGNLAFSVVQKQEGVITLLCAEVFNSSVSIEVWDGSGRLVKSVSTTQPQQDVALSSPGFYLVKLSAGNRTGIAKTILY